MGTNGDDNPLVLAYLTLRRVVGALGVLLPPILFFGALLLSSTGLQESISHYYGTVMRDVLVGILFAIGVFLYSYVGYQPSDDRRRFEPSDNIAGNLACFFAGGVALFPTTSDAGWVTTVHSVSAAGMFLTLSYFSLFLFTKTKKGIEPTPEKKTRNRWYRALGAIMLACIVLIPVYNTLLDETSIAAIKPIFWLESIALWAFGWSWAIKGDTLFKDAVKERATA